MRIYNGIYTIRNRTTGNHRTFRIRTQKDDAVFAPGKRIISVLTRSDNTDPRSYQKFGFVADDGSQIFVWKRYKQRPVNRSYSDHEYYAKVLMAMTSDRDTPAIQQWKEMYDLQVAKSCLRCNRLLTHPESLASGLGPECGARGSNSPVVDAPRRGRRGRQAPSREPQQPPQSELPDDLPDDEVDELDDPMYDVDSNAGQYYYSPPPNSRQRRRR